MTSPTPSPSDESVSPRQEVGPRVFRIGTLTYTSAGLALLFIWLLGGDFTWNMKERAVTPVAQLLLKKLETSDMLVGLLVGSLPAALGMILVPFVGVKSDRYRGRWGRRIPFILLSTPFIAVGLIGLGFTPFFGEKLHALWGNNSPGLQTSTLISFILFWTLFEVFSVIGNSVFMALINDVVPAEVMGKFFGLFRAVNLVAGIIFNYWLIGSAKEHFTLIFIGLGILYAGGMTWMCLKVKEGEYPPPSEDFEKTKNNFFKSIQIYIKECYSHPYYIWVFLAIALGLLAPGPMNSFSIFYAQSIGMTEADYGKYIVASLAFSLVFSYFLGTVADRFHPLRAGMVAIGLYAIFMIWGGLYATSRQTFVIAFIAHGILSGTYFTVAASLPQRMFPKEKFGQMASAGGILGALGYMLIPPLIGYFLDLSGHVYRYTFLFSGVLALLAFAAKIMVYRSFVRYGGPKNYVPPAP